MSASDNLSNELFFEAHRGMKLHSGNNFAVSPNLGMHWSSDPKVAERFSYAKDVPSSANVFHARVPVSSVETNTTELAHGQVFSHRGDPLKEQEIPVKEGAPVYVTGRTKYRRSGGILGELKSRTRRYNPPRNMTA